MAHPFQTLPSHITRGVNSFPHGKTGAGGIEVNGKGYMLLSASGLQLFGDIKKWLM
jgi:hypothetical protein